MRESLTALKPPTHVFRPVSLDSIDFTLLRDSMEKVGLLVPLTVGLDSYQIIDGYRRWLIAKEIGWTHIECHHVKGDPDDLRIITQTRQLEFGREEKRRLVGDLLTRERSLTAADLAQRLQWSPVEVESLAGVEHLIAEFAESYRAGNLRLSTVWQLSRCRDEGQLQLAQNQYDDQADLFDAAQALHREVRTARRRSMVSRPRGKGYAAIVRERDDPRKAGPELIRCNARTPLDGWRAALDWVLGGSQ